MIETTAPLLIDGWPDDGPEERAWVYALRELEYFGEVLEDNGLELVATGAQEWQRESPCLGCNGSGADDGWKHGMSVHLQTDLEGNVRHLVEGPAPACESCAGTGRQDGDEGYAYEQCDQLDEGAAAYWVLEVREAQPQPETEPPADPGIL